MQQFQADQITPGPWAVQVNMKNWSMSHPSFVSKPVSFKVWQKFKPWHKWQYCPTETWFLKQGSQETASPQRWWWQGYEYNPGPLLVAPTSSSWLSGIVCRRWFWALYLRLASSSTQPWKPADVFSNTAPTETWHTVAAKDFPAPGWSDYLMFIVSCFIGFVLRQSEPPI